MDDELLTHPFITPGKVFTDGENLTCPVPVEDDSWWVFLDDLDLDPLWRPLEGKCLTPYCFCLSSLVNHH